MANKNLNLNFEFEFIESRNFFYPHVFGWNFVKILGVRKLCRFAGTPTCVRQTDRQTDRWTDTGS